MCPKGKVQPTFHRGIWPVLSTLLGPYLQCGEILCFLDFCFIYFLFNDPPLISTGTSKPAPLTPQTSAKPTRKTDKRDTHQLFNGKFSMRLPLINRDSLRQRFIPPSKASFMPFSFTLPNLLFKSRNCKATICSNFSWSEKESQLSPRIIVSFLSPFFWYGHWDALARLRTQSLARAYSPLNINVITPSDESWA